MHVEPFSVSAFSASKDLGLSRPRQPRHKSAIRPALSQSLTGVAKELLGMV
jgi:hypothetical protein